MKQLPEGFTALKPATSVAAKPTEGMFIRLSQFPTNSGTGNSALISTELYVALGQPSHVDVAVSAQGQVIITGNPESGAFKVYPLNKRKSGRIAAGQLINAGLPIKTRIPFIEQDGYFISEATK